MKNIEKKKKIWLFICGMALIIAASIMMPYAIDTGFALIRERIIKMGALQTETEAETEVPLHGEEHIQAADHDGDAIIYTEAQEGLQQKFIADGYKQRFENTITNYVEGIYGGDYLIREITLLSLSPEADQLVCRMQVCISNGDREMTEFLEGTFNQEFCFYGFYPATDHEKE